MKITLVLHAHLRRYTASGQEEQRVALQAGESLGALLDRLGVPRNEVHSVLVDGRRVQWEHCPVEGERVEVLPAISGG